MHLWRDPNLIELSGNVLRFAIWDELWQVVEAAAIYWNARKHPFIWGHKRRYRPIAKRAPPLPYH